MTNGTSQGLFVIVAIVIFGIFVLISYILFKDNLKPSLSTIFTDSLNQTQINLAGNDLQELEIEEDDISNFLFEQIGSPDDLDLLRVKKNNKWEKIDAPTFTTFSVNNYIRTGNVGNFEEVQPYLNITLNMDCVEGFGTETCSIGKNYSTDNYIGIANNFEKSIPENLMYSLNIDSENNSNISAIYMNDILISTSNTIFVKKLFQSMNDLESITVGSNNSSNYLYTLDNRYTRHYFASNLMVRNKNEMRIETTNGVYKLPVDVSLFDFRLR